jgi:DNA repair protein RadC
MFDSIYKGMRCRVCLIREGEPEPVKIDGPKDIYQLVKEELATSDREMFLSIMLTTENRLIGVETVAVGSLNVTVVSPREVFKSAILANANAIVLCHNHPSGSLKPSQHDIEITEALIKAGRILDISIHDHMIVSHLGFISLRDSCTIPPYKWS